MKPEILTKRENQVVRCFVEGMTIKEVADKLCVSEYTVVNHIQNIYNKTGIKRCLNAMVSWWYCVSFPEIAKKVGASLMIICFCFQVSANFRQRTLPRKRNEIEFIETIACQ